MNKNKGTVKILRHATIRRILTPSHLKKKYKLVKQKLINSSQKEPKKKKKLLEQS